MPIPRTGTMPRNSIWRTAPARSPSRGLPSTSPARSPPHTGWETMSRSEDRLSDGERAGEERCGKNGIHRSLQALLSHDGYTTRELSVTAWLDGSALPSSVTPRFTSSRMMLRSSASR